MKRTLFLLAAVCSLSVRAYEVDTHGRMTQTSYERSLLKTDQELLGRLRFDRLLDPSPFQAPWRQDSIANGLLPGKTAYADALESWSGSDFPPICDFAAPRTTRSW
ncbi:MAG: hypothetical protein IPK97_08020 [Ahniella sp.]|nr:hypothetical protein [Ahniella sp.]